MPLLVVLGSARPSSAACPPQLCPGAGDCTISGTQTCTAPATLDLGGGALTIAEDATLQVMGGDGSLTITGAASVTLEANAKIVAHGSDGGGSVAVTSAGFVSLDASSTIDASGSFGGSIAITAQDGDLMAGSLKANGTNEEGGSVTLAAPAGSITLGGAGIEASASGDLDGGEVTVTASGDITLNALVKARGHGGGFGGDVNIAGSGKVVVDANIDVGSAGDDAGGGTVSVTAGSDLDVEASILASARNASDGLGGDVALAAVGDVLIASSTIDVGADIAGIISVGPLEDPLTQLISVQLAQLLADGSSGADGVGGEILLQACNVQVIDSLVSALGSAAFPSGTNVLLVSGELTVNATLKAGDTNRIEFRRESVNPPSGDIEPPPEFSRNQDLPCCADDVCTPPPPTTTTSTTIAATSTTTTITSTTSTSPTLPATTSTSSTSVPSTNVQSSTTAPASTVVTTTAPLSGSTSTSTPSTASGPTTTSSTAPPVSCLDQPLGGFDAADCRLGVLSDTLRSSTPDALGGAKSARILGTKVTKALHLIETARTKAKRKPILRRAKKQLQAFRKLAQRGVNRHRLDGTLGAQLVSLAGETIDLIDQLRAAP